MLQKHGASKYPAHIAARLTVESAFHGTSSARESPGLSISDFAAVVIPLFFRGRPHRIFDQIGPLFAKNHFNARSASIGQTPLLNLKHLSEALRRSLQLRTTSPKPSRAHCKLRDASVSGPGAPDERKGPSEGGRGASGGRGYASDRFVAGVGGGPLVAKASSWLVPVRGDAPKCSEDGCGWWEGRRPHTEGSLR